MASQRLEVVHLSRGRSSAIDQAVAAVLWHMLNRIAAVVIYVDEDQGIVVVALLLLLGINVAFPLSVATRIAIVEGSS